MALSKGGQVLLEVYGQDRADFIDSGPRYARIDADRMFTFHMA